MAARPRAELAGVLDRALGDLTTAAISTMEHTLPWFAGLDAEHRSWIGSIAHDGIRGFTAWLRSGEGALQLTADVFGVAPRVLTRVVTLQQTVAMVRTTIEVVESKIDDLFGPEDAEAVRTAISLYAREVAFAAADVYARAAEARGAWDARLEALIVDSVLRGETDEVVRSRAAAVGWSASGAVAVVVGHAPEGATRDERAGSAASGHASPDRDAANSGVIEAVHRHARQHALSVLCSVHGDRLVVILGGVDDLDKAAASVCEMFGAGPVVIGPAVDDLTAAYRSARSAISGLRAAPGWAMAPRPVRADDLLAERALAGDGHARHSLVHGLYLPLLRGDATMMNTLSAYLEAGASIEATARRIFVHPNTVRYRLRKAADISGLDPAHPRDAYTLRIAITLGRLLAQNSDETL